MATREKTQEQIELFSGGDDSGNRRALAHSSEPANITVRLDTLAVSCIGILLVVIVAFSIGVEKGKRTFAFFGEKAVASLEVPARVKQQEVTKTVQQASVPSAAAKNSQAAAVAPARPAGGAAATTQPSLPVPQQKSTTGTYTVQIASYAQQSFAEREARKLQKQGYQTLIMSKGKFIVLCVGNFSDRSTADILRKKLRTQYGDCVIRRL